AANEHLEEGSAVLGHRQRERRDAGRPSEAVWRLADHREARPREARDEVIGGERLVLAGEEVVEDVATERSAGRKRLLDVREPAPRVCGERAREAVVSARPLAELLDARERGGDPL